MITMEGLFWQGPSTWEIRQEDFAKANVTYIGLKLALSLGYKKVLIQGDYLNIIKYLKRFQRPSWTIQGLIMDCLEITNTLDDFLISDIYIGKQIMLQITFLIRVLLVILFIGGG